MTRLNRRTWLAGTTALVGLGMTRPLRAAVAEPDAGDQAVLSLLGDALMDALQPPMSGAVGALKA